MAVSVSNIFELVGRFGAEEDRLTASFGFLLKNDQKLFGGFARSLALDLKAVAEYDITTQTAYRLFGFEESDERNRIDLEIVRAGQVTILIESKIGGNKFSQTQLEKYARLLKDRRSRGDAIRLVLVTHLDERMRFQDFLPALGLQENEACYLRWTDVCDLVSSGASPRHKFLTQQFLEQVRRRMSDLKVISELPVGNVREVMIVTVNSSNMRKALMEHQYECQNQNPRRQDSQYIAFYETGGAKYIRYVARVEKTEINVPVTWGVAKVYTIQKPFELRAPIVLGRIPANFPVLYTTFERLLSASTVDELRIRKGEPT
jgi:hypothetical protein